MDFDIKAFRLAIITTGLLIIGLMIYQLKINDDIKNESKVKQKLEWSKNIVSLNLDSVFTVGIADYYYRDLIIPTNKKLDYFYIGSDSDVTKIIKKDTIPTIKKYSTITYKRSKLLFFKKKWEVEKSIFSFVLTIPRNSVIKTIKSENQIDSIRLMRNIIVK